jgi:cellulose synthase/poly-beta-1,6-N-acetylglucosamine synthase-like glycosyltransferase
MRPLARDDVIAGRQPKRFDRPLSPLLKALALAVWAAALVSIALRVWHGFPRDGLILSLAFFLFEILLLASSLSFLQAVVRGQRAPSPPVPPVPSGVSVDILIPTLDEPPTLLRRTLRRAVAVRYPHRTWVLDDGGRDEVRVLAEQLGCGYLSRSDAGTGGKAGNINAGVAMTSGELILVLDADAIPHATILERTLGFFADPRVALVQTPQVFYNVDAFETDYDPVRRTYWSPLQVLQHSVQRGLGATGMAMCVGSGFVVRRSAFVAVGGFPPSGRGGGEDVLLSHALHLAGFRTCFLDEAVAFHLAADGLGPFWTQQQRWARGAMRFYRETTRSRGLSLSQWLFYFRYLIRPHTELVRYALRFVPVYAAFVSQPIHSVSFLADRWAVAINAIAIVLSYLAVPIVSHGRVRSVVGRSLAHLRAGPTLSALAAELAGLPSRFKVTEKGAGARPPRGVYILPVVAGLLGLVGLSTLLVRVLAHAGEARAAYSLWLIAAFCLELGFTGVLALWVARGRYRTLEATTVVVRRTARFVPTGRPAEVVLEVVRLGTAEAYCTGPIGVERGSGELTIVLADGEHVIAAEIEPAPNRLHPAEPRLACYRLTLHCDAAACDRLADAIDANEIPRIFTSLAEPPCASAPGSEPGAPNGIPLYRVRPSFPPIRL